ncbi:MAG: mechanosensitive ion channel, partial [Chloroflexota bacterium]|nr:mechanosensitive ion channel [Chloroflexota bacterium]
MDFLDNLIEPLGIGLLNLLIALLILIVGYIAARIVASITRRLLKKTNLDNRLADSLSEPDKPRKFVVEDVIAKIVFWIIMLFVLAAFFSRLNLQGLATPIDAFLHDFTVEYLPRVAAAAIILIVAWLVATALKLLIKKGTSLLKLDERLSEHAALEDEERVSFGDSLANAVFWFVLLLALPTALRALGFLEVSEPIQDVFDTIFNYVPNILAALVIFGIGWFVARVIREVVANLLKAIGTDSLGARIGLSEERSLSALIGSILYIIILLVTVIAAIGQLNIAAISEPTTEMLSTIINTIPNLIGAALVLVIAYFVAKLVADLLRDLLSSIGFDSVPERLGLKWSAATTPSQWIGYLVLVAIMLFATVSALELLGSEALTGIINVFVAFFWKVILAAVIFAIGMYMANMAYKAIHTTGINQSNFIGRMAQ